MAKFHINPDTGNVGSCSASAGRCPFADAEEHFPSAESARTAYETKMAVAHTQGQIIMNKWHEFASDMAGSPSPYVAKAWSALREEINPQVTAALTPIELRRLVADVLSNENTRGSGSLMPVLEELNELA